MDKIRKAVFPVAGLGTRFLPATKATPKEMLPIVDKPLIQYAVEEAVAAGMTELILVTSSSKRAVEDHFDSNHELESTLEARGKLELLSIIRNILPKDVVCSYVRQSEQLGLGHAVHCAKQLVGDEPFAVLLADDLIENNHRYCLEEMVDVYEQTHASVIAVETVDPDETEKYGIVKLANNTTRISGIVEKPKPKMAPSNLAVVGRYILTPRIFDLLETVKPGAGGEIQLTDAIAALLAEEAICAHTLTNKRFDCGSKLGYLEATVAYGLRHEDVGDEFKAFLEGVLESV